MNHGALIVLLLLPEWFCFHFPLLAICSTTLMSLSMFSAFLGFLLRMLHSWNCFVVYAGKPVSMLAM
jgi:hypothetical protein